jgi:hypothetical protein
MDTDRPEKITLVSLSSPSGQEGQKIRVHAAEMIRKYGPETGFRLVQQIGRDVVRDELILVDVSFSAGDGALIASVLSHWLS